MGRGVICAKVVRRLEVLLGVGGASTFVVLMICALAIYQQRTGHPDPWLVFFSDLMADRDKAGQSNALPRALSLGAMFCASVGLLAAFFRTSEAPAVRRWLRRAIRGSALIACLGLAGVAIATALGKWQWHDRLTLLVGPIGVGGFALCLAVQHRTRAVAPLLVAYFTLFFASWNLLQYGRQALLAAPRWTYLPVVQKTAAFFLALWIVLTVVLRPHSAGTRSPPRGKGDKKR